ncbi:hypothetical protein BDZ31_004817 [Conexibacter arvalis]|uniref:Ig-like domain-containing protein n=2 Tax=Conexibacter arvalis TaxID=912552 RepID=A0A840IK97_9ACTN|nr:hypothetical protein [Conexibacter arvalis]
MSRLRRAGAAAAALAALALMLPIAASAAPPSLSVMPIPAMPEDVPRAIDTIVVSDDSGGPVTLAVAAGSGTFSASSGGGVVASGSGTSSVTLTGTPDALNSRIAGSGLVYAPARDFNGTVALSVVVTDDEGLSDTFTTTFLITAVNDPPIVTVPATYATGQERELALTGVDVADVDAGDGIVSLTVTASGGGTVTAATDVGVAVTPVSGGIRLDGTIAGLQAAFQSGRVRYQPAAGFSGDESLTVTLDDNGNTGAGGALTSTGTAIVTVVPSPSVVAVEASPAPGTIAGIGGTVAIRVRFDRPVAVRTSGGRPVLLLASGAASGVATYAGGSGSDTLTFAYTVAEGDASAALDYRSTAALELRGATIDADDATAPAADLTLPAPGGPGSLADTSALAIDGVRPLLTAFERIGPASVGDGAVAWQVRFSEPVSGVGAPAFALVATGTARGAISSVTQVDATTWRVTASGVGGEGSLGLVLAAASAVVDAAGNGLAADAAGPSFAVAPSDQPIKPPPADLTPLPIPEVRVVEAPAELTRSRDARIAFAVDPSAAFYECRLDGGPWQPCASPRTASGLRAGDHVVEIRAVMSDGRRGATVARAFQVNPYPPGVRVGGRRVLRTARGGGRVPLAISCSRREGAGRGLCSGSAQLVLALPSGKRAVGTRLLGSAPFRAAAGRAASVRIRLTPSARRTLARAGARGLRVRVVVTARDLAGNSRTYSTARTLRRG